MSIRIQVGPRESGLDIQTTLTAAHWSEQDQARVDLALGIFKKHGQGTEVGAALSLETPETGLVKFQVADRGVKLDAQILGNSSANTALSGENGSSYYLLLAPNGIWSWDNCLSAYGYYAPELKPAIDALLSLLSEQGI